MDTWGNSVVKSTARKSMSTPDRTGERRVRISKRLGGNGTGIYSIGV